MLQMSGWRILSPELIKSLLPFSIARLDQDYCGRGLPRRFSAHGSFIILTYQAVSELSPIFHEDMFLYNEELYLAHRCKLLQIPVYYVPTLKVIHLEGASSTIQSNAWKNHEDSYRVLSSWMRKHHF